MLTLESDCTKTEALPKNLRAVLAAGLAAGGEMAGVGPTFSALSAHVSSRLAKPAPLRATLSRRTPAAQKTARCELDQGTIEMPPAVLRHAADLIPDPIRIALLVEALQTALFVGGVGQARDQIPGFHPLPIVEVLLRGVLHQQGDVAVHFVAMLCFIHGQPPEPCDLAQRRFFLRFNTGNRGEREAAFRDLCERIGADAARYLPGKKFENLISSHRP